MKLIIHIADTSSNARIGKQDYQRRVIGKIRNTYNLTKNQMSIYTNDDT